MHPNPWEGPDAIRESALRTVKGGEKLPEVDVRLVGARRPVENLHGIYDTKRRTLIAQESLPRPLEKTTF